MEEPLRLLRQSCAALVAGSAVLWTLWQRTPLDLLSLLGETEKEKDWVRLPMAVAA